MTWLLRLYPRAWRHRYGAEVAEMISGRGFSLRIAIDVIAGAIDVWLHPSLTLAAASAAAPSTQERNMLSRILRLDCAAAYGPGLAKEDAWKAAASMIGSCLALTVGWLMLRARFPDHPVVDALGMMPFFIGMLLSARYTYLKGRSPAVQAIFIGAGTLLFTVFFIVVGLIASRI